MRRPHPPTFAACSSGFSCLLLPVRRRAGGGFSEKGAASRHSLPLTRISEGTVLGEERKSRKSRGLARRPSEDAACSAKRSTKPLPTDVGDRGCPRTAACSRGANAPRCASSSVGVRASRRSMPRFARRGAKTRMGIGLMIDSGGATKRFGVPLSGSKWRSSVLVDGAVCPAVYGPITSTRRRSQQSLMSRRCSVRHETGPYTPHCRSVRTQGEEGSHG